LPATVEKLSDTRVKLVLDITQEDLGPALKKAYQEFASTMNIPGFRKGHVPPGIVDTHVGKDAVLAEAVNGYLPQVYAEAIASHGLTPLAQPEMNVTTLIPGETVQIEAEVDILPDFELPDMSSLSAEVEALDNLDTQVEEKLGLLRERFAQVEDVERACHMGDQVKIDLVARRDGEVLGDADAQGLTYVIGSGQMLDGLDEALIGSQAGEEKTFTSSLVGGGLEGQDADITVKLTQVQSRILPEVDDEFAQMVSQFDTVGEMMDDLRSAVEHMGLMDQFAVARGKILDEVIAQTSLQLPSGVIDQEAASRTSQMLEQLKSAGLSLEDYLERVGDETMNTPEQFHQSTRDSVTRGISAEIILDRLAQDQQIQVTQHDLTNFVLQRAQENGTTPDQEIEHMQSHNHIGEWMSQIRQAKALDFLTSQAKVTDSSGHVVDVASVVQPDEVGDLMSGDPGDEVESS